MENTEINLAENLGYSNSREPNEVDLVKNEWEGEYLVWYYQQLPESSKKDKYIQLRSGHRSPEEMEKWERAKDLGYRSGHRSPKEMEKWERARDSAHA